MLPCATWFYQHAFIVISVHYLKIILNLIENECLVRILFLPKFRKSNEKFEVLISEISLTLSVYSINYFEVTNFVFVDKVMTK